MMKKHIRFLSLIGISIAASGCSFDRMYLGREKVEPLPPVPNGNVQEEQLPEGAVGKLVSNYISGVLSEIRQDIPSAAHYYNKAQYFDKHNLDLAQRSFSSNLAAGNMERAKFLATQLKQSESTVMMVAIFQAMHLASERQFSDAFELISQLREESPKVLPFHLIYAYLDLAKGQDVDAVVQELRDIPQNPFMDAYRYYHIGRLLEGFGRIDDAVEAYENAYTLDSTSIFNVIALGRAYELTNETDKAREVYKEFTRSNPESLLLQPVITRLEKSQRARRHELDTRSDLAEVIFGFGTIMVSQDLPIAARQLINMSIMLDKNYPYSQFYLAVLDEQEGDLAKAVKSYGKVSPKQHTWLASQVRKAESMFSLGEEETAIKELEMIKQKTGVLTQINRVLAEMFYDRKDFNKAIAVYDELLTEDIGKKREAVYLFARGASQERLGHYDKASKDLSRSIELEPNNPVALNYLGYMWVDMDKNVDEGFAYINKAMLLRPNDGAIVDSLGWAYFKRGEYAKSVILLERAAEMRPEDGVIISHLGDVYEKLGRMDEAVSQWERALEMGVDSEREQAHLQKKLLQYKSADMR